MLSKITITCFAASYAVTLGLEITRLFFRAPVRLLVMLGFALAGLFAHSVFLISLARAEMAGMAPTPLASWFDWCLMASWIMAATYIFMVLRRPENTVGLFMLPLVLALIGIAVAFRDAAPFERDRALSVWRLVHGSALLMGTVVVVLGFAAGVMYLVQSYRLKNKLLPKSGLRLPSLEWLQQINRRSLWMSAGLLAVGLISGIALNLINRRSDSRSVPWSDPVVVSSGILFLWLTAAALFEWLYKPARQGRKVAYLTLASFVFLGLVLFFVLSEQHATSPDPVTMVDVRTTGSSFGDAR
jgi:hypothetical protein